MGIFGKSNKPAPARTTIVMSVRTKCACCGKPLTRGECSMCTGALDGFPCECQRP